MKKILFVICLLFIPIKTFAIEIDKDINSGIILSSEANVLPNDFVTETQVTYLIGTQNSLAINNEINNPKTTDSNFFPLILISILGLIGIMLLFIKLYIDNKEKI